MKGGYISVEAVYGVLGLLFSSETSDDGHSTGVCIGSPPFYYFST